jgi:hypothetical protein
MMIIKPLQPTAAAANGLAEFTGDPRGRRC